MGIRIHSSAFLTPALASILCIAGCSNSSTGSTPIQNQDSTYTVGGTVSGLSGGQLVLQNNDADNLTISSNGSFTFSTAMIAGDSFFVTVFTQPSGPAQSCVVNNPGGSVTTANATSVQVVCAALPASPPQIQTAANQWTWAGGPNVPNQAGDYGQLGTPAAGNIPGARVGAVGWTDQHGNFWLFGGEGPPFGGWCGLLDPLCKGPTYPFLNDLWKFDGSEWAWMGGSSSINQAGIYGTLGQAAAGNVPGSRYGAASWSDGQGNFWLFGGEGYDSAGNTGALNDLWEYTAGEWAWMGGSKLANQPGVYGTKGTPASGNSPGSRSGAVAFADPSGNVWLFGGEGYDSSGSYGVMSDLWQLSGGKWTWVSGLSTTFPAQPGVYGTLGTPSPSNVPGGRYSTTAWMDHAGNLWIFGGLGYNTVADGFAELDDFLKFGSGEWTWEGGPDNIAEQPGTYGTEGTPAAGNIPGSRDSAESWTDANGNLWLFSGEGMTAVPGEAGSAEFNDLWEYSGGEWTWVGGTNSGVQSGVYGTQGVPSPGNIAGARMGAVTWTDAKGNFWLFGGFGAPAAPFGGLGGDPPSGTAGYLNDLWVYQP